MCKLATAEVADNDDGGDGKRFLFSLKITFKIRGVGGGEGRGSRGEGIYV